MLRLPGGPRVPRLRRHPVRFRRSGARRAKPWWEFPATLAFRRSLRPAPQARTKASLGCSRRGREVTNILFFCRGCRTNRAAVHPAPKHTDKEFTVEARVSRQARAGTNLQVDFHTRLQVMIAAFRRCAGRFRTTLRPAALQIGRIRNLQFGRSEVRKRPRFSGFASYLVKRFMPMHIRALRGMSEMLHALFDWFQSLLERHLSDPDGAWIL